MNTFELKSYIINILNKYGDIGSLQESQNEVKALVDLDQNDIIRKILVKEIPNVSKDRMPIICALVRIVSTVPETWNTIQEVAQDLSINQDARSNFIHTMINPRFSISFDDCEQHLGEDVALSVLDEHTKEMLKQAVINPEVQIDFIDFLKTLDDEEKVILLNSLDESFSNDARANIMVPIFFSNPESVEGKQALSILGSSNSQIALHALNEAYLYAGGELAKNIKSNLAKLKLRGMRIDNTRNFYNKILSNSKPYKFYITIPDGHGNSALIFIRIKEDNRLSFVSIVANVDDGIKDCFGFYDVSQFECDKMIERYARNEKLYSIPAQNFKVLLGIFETRSIKNTGWKLPYEYVCWKNLLMDVDFETFDIDACIKDNIKILEPENEDILKKILNSEIAIHWFFEPGYCDLFDEMLTKLHNCNSLDIITSDYVSKIFNLQERTSWIRKLYNVTYVLYSCGYTDLASAVYTIYKNDSLKNALYLQVMKRSIYEYFSIIKYDNSKNINNYTYEEIDKNIKYIEGNWCIK